MYSDFFPGLLTNNNQYQCQNDLLFRHLELVLYSLQTTEEVLGLAEDGEEPRGVPIDHDAEDKLLPLGADPFELVWYRDEPLHLPEIARSHFLKRRTELQAALPVHKKERNKLKKVVVFFVNPHTYP